jgi:hypothetical protein
MVSASSSFSFARKLIITQDTFFFSGSMVAQVKEPFIKQSYYLTIYQGGEAFLGMGLGEGSAV